MKKTVIIVVTILFFSSIFPSQLLAEGPTVQVQETQTQEADSVQEEPVLEKEHIESPISSDISSENNEVKDSSPEELETKEVSESTDVTVENKSVNEEYNELGVKIGIEVYGEDISKLSEAELQYIPQGWRDGNYESEHKKEGQVQKKSFLMMAAYPNLNSYIFQENLASVKTEYSHKSSFPKFPYRYGAGKVEGVVAHETATDGSTIDGEISYMTRNYNNAFVHAFVDHSRIIEIHPTDYAAWGGGRFANQRFVHVELVRVNSFDQFARSINNYSSYIASLLYKYNLNVTSAEASGQGTLWSHKAVAVYLGGTDHVDPHGYFQKWGYNWNEFVKLVTVKYNKLAIKKSDVSKLGQIKNSNGVIYQDPTNPYLPTKQASSYTNSVYYIKQEAKFSGSTYYLLSEKPSSKDGVIGWVHSKDLVAYGHIGVDKNLKRFVVKGTGKAYTKAWGGSSDIALDNLTSFAGLEFSVDLTESVGTNVWYRGLLNGRKVWIHSSYLSVNVVQRAADLLGHLKNTEVRIFKQLDNLSGFKYAGTQYSNQVYQITKQANLNNENYYLITNPISRAAVGWVREKDTLANAFVEMNYKLQTVYLTGEGSLYNNVWGGPKNVVIANLANFVGREFKPDLVGNVGNEIWYRGSFEGKRVWINSRNLTIAPQTKTSMLGKINNSNVKIHKTIESLENYTVAGNQYINTTFYIKKQVLVNGQLFYSISNEPSYVKGIVGWVKAEDITALTHQGVDKKSKTFYINGNVTGYSRAWGGGKDAIYQKLSQSNVQLFEVHLTEKVGNETWYRGRVNGKTFWVQSSKVSSLHESKTSKLGHLRNKAAKIYREIGNESSSIPFGINYLNTVYYIKKQAVINNDVFYLISREPSSVKGIVGWVKAGDISVHAHISVKKSSQLFAIKGTGKAYNKAWGGSKDLVFPNLSQLKGDLFKVNLIEKVGNNTWYRGSLNGKQVWVHSSYVTTKVEAATSKLGHLRSSNAKIFKRYSDLSFYRTAGKANMDSVYYIKIQAFIKGSLYYLISREPSSIKGVVGWVNSKDLSTHSHSGYSKNNKVFYMKGSGSAYKKAWGGSRDLVYKRLSSYKNKVFKVHLAEKVGNNIWYKGSLNGKVVWIHSSYLKSK
ncbi:MULTISPECIES: GW dipeptide domain-containing protein [unclassified Mesobacillus]|uniref:GW dipeptide domain-containing protein n=1 Tax=unclassified Mesobacillus TaxID=2675270 RepID=UPI00203E9278|nr:MULTISPECIES: GW dipeptide domain-containing protein [unclassified Mesobacillus]MCM3124156.1 GW dipeptide domain-containing protein [Mesobacillus sp. MER 33]MCM3234005.1 GW dipeptide domain-containing protein [Mesobacillus sp. MER 48]